MTGYPPAPSTFIHPTAEVDPTATIGDGTKIWRGVGILWDVKIGQNCSIGGLTEVGHHTTIGDGSRIGYNVFIPNNARIGKNVFVGPNVTFCDDMHPRVRLSWEQPYTAQPPIIEDGAAIGAGVVILPGIHIGRGAKIAAGSVVTKNVGDYVTVRGGRAAYPVDGPKEWDTEVLNTESEAKYQARISSL